MTLYEKLNTVKNLLYVISNKAEGHVRKYKRTKYLALFNSDEKYEIIFEGITYLIMLKSKISAVCSY